MALLINIQDLLNQNKVEGERIEFKKGWNPDAIMRTVCAFANDFENTGSGYVLIGVDEEDGVAVRPVEGVQLNQIDKIQQELLGYCNQIQPSYFPKISVEEVDGKKLIALSIPAGSNRPYKVPDSVTSKKNKVYNYRIRWGSNSIVPNEEQETELLQLTANVPFDDRLNQNASVKDLDFGLMRQHLSETGSRLFDDSAGMSIEELAEKMNLSAGADEHLFPKNVGLLMFSADPTNFFKSAHIDIVEFPDGEGAATFSEQVFSGSIQQQLRDALAYLKINVVKSKVMKSADSAKAPTIYSYPFAALEEVLPNAVYHRNYEESEPVEIRVLQDRMIITSYNGADPSLKQRDFDAGTIRARRYRNRRVGEFLKELDLTEGRGTGIPRLQKALKDNGSPPAVFDVDDPERRYFVVEIPIHPEFLMRSVDAAIAFDRLTKRQHHILELLFDNDMITYPEMVKKLAVSSTTIQKDTDAMKELGTISRAGTKGGTWLIHYQE